ncbi:MAG: DNA polymerase III subunit delta [Clostridiaceae bacterium]|nr:DNA polymerase III subunit delta [Clostridiaceae bacterium]
MKRIKEDIKTNSFHPVYLLYGEETYLVRLYRDDLIKAILAEDSDDMNFSRFQGNGIDFHEVREIANTLPFFQEHRLVLLEDTGLIKHASDFAEDLAAMPESTIVIFVEKEIDKRNKLYKYISKNGLAVEMGAMSAADTKKFIALHLKENGKIIRQSTVEYFMEQTENSLTNIQNELDKLVAYTLGREEICPADIDAVCSVQVTGQIFQMLDAVAEGKQTAAMKLYHDLLELKESPMSILYLLTRHFNILLQIKDSSGELSRTELAKKVGVPPFAVGKYQIQAKRFEYAKLKQMLCACVDTEYDFKRGRIKDQIGVELLLVNFICQRKIT